MQESSTVACTAAGAVVASGGAPVGAIPARSGGRCEIRARRGCRRMVYPAGRIRRSGAAPARRPRLPPPPPLRRARPWLLRRVGGHGAVEDPGASPSSLRRGGGHGGGRARGCSAHGREHRGGGAAALSLPSAFAQAGPLRRRIGSSSSAAARQRRRASPASLLPLPSSSQHLGPAGLPSPSLHERPPVPTPPGHPRRRPPPERRPGHGGPER